MISRRETLKGVALLAATAPLEKTTDGGYAPVSLPGVPPRPSPVLPPNAAPDFRVKCVGCALCVSACPVKVLRPSASWSRFGQPEMDFREGYCRLACRGNCADVCPTGAIRPLDGLSRRDVHMGHAIWKKDLCVRVTKGEPCTACVRKCPVAAIEIVEGFPVVDKTKCVGCGACEHVCPSRPMPAIFVKGFARQRVVRPVSQNDLVAEMLRRIEAGASVVAAVEGKIVAERTGRGIAPLMSLYDAGLLKGALVVDKVVGRAAAAICIAGGARRVYAKLMSAAAERMLAAAGVGCGAVETSVSILNREHTGICPMDRAVNDFSEPTEMVDILRKAMKK